ncbi:methyltransferase family protein [Oceanirhabdus sp. W0125-5]|uniref:methyltransferase family protein n=1 Tax=Oceanirhabdus sp. W0125-5 TaxID=2999116 RepID=UPI0022F2B5FD|nr:isoprenylcysteine carboxylmethyltransferase family protein [Oceanirhabdus sp. W0125-5]WBW95053.1 isoprenylcysteine carboxylmethyltransferase family protein [Oceanirhabdus sp. W0125-5]
MNTYKIIGIIIYLSFYGSYFAKMFSQSKSGIKTDRMGKGIKPKKTFVIEVILKMITLMTAVIQLISILFIKKILILIQKDWFIYSGFIISTIGVIIFIIAMVTMHDSWRAGIDNTQDTKMISNGIYKYSRNPAFVGFDLFYIGLALSFSNVFNVFFACASIVMFHFQILEEEKFLNTIFGNEYLDYKKKTWRYFGK